MNFEDIYQRYWKSGYVLTDINLSGIDREMFRTLFNPIAEIFRKYPAGDVHLYLPGTGNIQGLVTGNYQDSAGTTQAAVDQPVGLVLDAAGSVGAELLSSGLVGATTNTGSSIVDGVLTMAGAVTGYSAFKDGTGLQPNRSYRVTATYSVTSNCVILLEGASTTAFSGTGVSAWVVNTPASTPLQRVQVNNSAGVSISGTMTISIKEVTGIHASQSTPGYKPTLRRGIVNLLTYSNDLTNVIWNTAAVGKTVNRITPDATNALHRVFHGSTTVTSGVPYTSAILAKADGYRYLYVNGAASGDNGQVCFDLQTGTVAATTDGVGTIVAIGDGSYLCCVSSTSASASNTLYLQVNNSANAYDTTFAGDGTSGIYCYASGLFQGTLTAAQILAAGGIPLTTTAPASSSAGQNYLEFDGVADRLSLSGIPFQASDDFTLLAACRTETASSYPFVFSITDGAAQSSHIGILFSQGKPALEVRGAGGFVGVSSASTVSQQACVISGKKVGSTLSGRVNGSSIGATSLAGAGAVNTLTTGTIGARLYDVLSLPIRGNVHAVIAIKGAVSDADLIVLEKFVASLSGVQL